ncbi:MAG: major coat protein [Alishewanella aestuarii]
MKNVKTKAALLLAALTSGAALADATAAMTSIKTEAESLIDQAWPIIVAIVVAGIGMKLFKKFASKAT